MRISRGIDEIKVEYFRWIMVKSTGNLRRSTSLSSTLGSTIFFLENPKVYFIVSCLNGRKREKEREREREREMSYIKRRQCCNYVELCQYERRMVNFDGFVLMLLFFNVLYFKLYFKSVQFIDFSLKCGRRQL